MKSNFILVGTLIALISFATADVSENRAKRGLLGGSRQLDEQELKLEGETLSKTLSKLATGDGPSYTIVKIYSGTKQVVSGSLVKLDADILDASTGKTERGLISLWSQPWLEKDGYEVTVEWKDKPKIVHRVSRSVDEVGTRAKRQLGVVGGKRPLNDDELKEQDKILRDSFAKLATGDGPNYSVSKIVSGTIQVVSGVSVEVVAELINEDGAKEDCNLSLWSQAWLKEDNNQLTINCKDKPQSVHRYTL